MNQKEKYEFLISVYLPSVIVSHKWRNKLNLFLPVFSPSCTAGGGKLKDRDPVFFLIADRIQIRISSVN